MMGATGAVGGHVVDTLLTFSELTQLTLLGRRTLDQWRDPRVTQQHIDIHEPASYQPHMPDHDVAICTLGVGQPSKISREDFVAIDKRAVLAFARSCKDAGVRHFELLSSVGANAHSASFFLRVKGELIDEIEALDFERFSIFQPSMILTPTNRYGLSQAITLRVWPWLKPVLLGPLQKFRGIDVARLGRAMAVNLNASGAGLEKLAWRDLVALTADAA